ncbi:putative endopeptidase [Inhella inkyongensis]|uniref:Putative endopeptidase n=1 Tax=Inhella inkyongensis TaxID=392593 RepID=A0A840SA27_9BURK|nr:M13 family metallopeptidase [Inhella inkyongensis]MBB5205259.1 putative endopeptidase [Inhella inkyongensis]
MKLLSTAAAALTLCLASAAGAHSGIDTSGIDAEVRAQDDLFRAVNGGWLKRTEIPADKSRWGTFIQLRDQSDREVREIVQRLAAQAQAPGSVAEKVALYYQAYTDTAAIDAGGLAPVQPLLQAIEALQKPADLARWMGRQQGQLQLPINISIEPDPKKPDVYAAIAGQGGLGVPDRDYYLKDQEPRYVKAVAAYRTYLETLGRLAGLPDPVQAAEHTIALEKQMAATMWDKVSLRDPNKTYNPHDRQALRKLGGGFDWTLMLQAAQLQRTQRVIVGQPSALAASSRLLAQAPIAQWRDYLKLHTLSSVADTLPQGFRDALFAYKGTALQGAKEERPRWQQGIEQVNAALGEAVGQLYVAEHFPPEAKQRMLTLVGNLLGSFGDSLEGLSWMGPQTKQQARAKLASYTVKIGYPERWRDYGALQVKAGDALGNGERAGRFEWARNARRVGQAVDKKEWGMTPQTVNAYYNPLANEIVFPAAILRPPFFDLKADDAVNYGAIGAVIGHEISHGFDDEGSQFDAKGALRNWWTPADRKAFDALGDRLVAQYGEYEPVPGKKLNGRLTLGENIADLSGLQIAFKAYRKSLGGKDAPVLDGLSGEQRFFYGWSQAWRSKARESYTLQMLTVDPHSPAEFRANGAAVNHDGFHEAFGTRAGDKMFKPSEQRIRIW